MANVSPSRPRASSFSCLALATAALLVEADAQCTTQWLPGHGVPGVDTPLWAATVWQPGVGGPKLVVAGSFALAGTVPAANIAALDLVTQTWTALGAGLPGVVWAVAALPNGDLVAGGFNNPFTPTLVHGVYVWNGTTWSPLGGGVNGSVGALTVLPNGDLIVGGSFTHAGSVFAPNLARWDGINWHPVAQGTQGFVKALAQLPNGTLAIAESFSSTLLPWAPGWVVRIHLWDGTNWSTVAQPSMPVRCLAALPNGDLVAAGSFQDIGNYVARWDGTSWTNIGGIVEGTQPVVEGLLALPNGHLIATGRFSVIGDTPAAAVAQWDGVYWSPLGNGLDGVGMAAVQLPAGQVAVVGNFATAGAVETASVALWDGVDWHAPGTGLDGPVHALAVAPNGDLYAGGAFARGLGTTLHGIARWDGAAWHALGTGFTGGYAHAVARLANGDVVAAGAFLTAGGTFARAIARWNGSSWSALGSGLAGSVVPVGHALAELPNGDVIVAGDFTTAGGVAANAIARWNGTSWAPLGTGLQGGVLGTPIGRALAEMPNGDVVVGGRFQLAGGVVANCVARWDGTAWSAMGFGLGAGATVRSLVVLPNGDLVAGGELPAVMSGVARWNGSQWSGVGALGGTVQSVVALPNGDIVAGGHFVGASFMRWSNGAWVPFAAGRTALDVFSMQMLPNGELVIAADFPPTFGEFWSRILRVGTTCPAAAVVDGAGCYGSGGLNVLTAATLPWLGTTFRANASGLATNALAVGVVGLGNPAAPLSSLMPQGLPGCTLFVTPDVLSLHVPSGGTVQLPVVIPNTIALAAQTFRQQVVAVEVGTSGVTALTSANALSLTIGGF